MKKDFLNYGIYFMLLCLLLFIQKSILQYIPNSYNIRFQTENTEGITIGQFMRSFDEEAINYGFGSEIKSDTGRGDCNVKKVLVNDIYLKSFPYQLLKGQIPDSFMIENQERVAMIDQELALKLFFSSDVLGRHISLDGMDYKIAGVYKDKSFSFVKDQCTRVFIPYKSADGWENVRIDTISILKNENWEGKLEKLRMGMGAAFDKYVCEDIGESKQFIQQGGKILRFFVGVFIIVLFLKRLIHMIKELCIGIVKNLKEKYLKEVLKQYRLEIIRICFFCTIVFGTIISLWKLLQFSFLIPSDFMPEENIFDISCYWNVLLQKVKLYHSGILAGSGNIHRSFVFCHILNFIIFYLGARYTYKIWKDDKVFKITRTNLVWFSITEAIAFIVIYRISISEIAVTVILMINLLLLKRIRVDNLLKNC